MFIPDFWVGVGATLGIEIAAIFIAAVVCATRNKNGGAK